jgi:hypothetical protein
MKKWLFEKQLTARNVSWDVGSTLWLILENQLSHLLYIQRRGEKQDTGQER